MGLVDKLIIKIIIRIVFKLIVRLVILVFMAAISGKMNDFRQSMSSRLRFERMGLCDLSYIEILWALNYV